MIGRRSSRNKRIECSSFDHGRRKPIYLQRMGDSGKASPSNSSKDWMGFHHGQDECEF